MQTLIEAWKSREEYFDLTASLMQRKPAAFTGLPVLPRAALAAALFQDLPFSMLVLAATEDEAMAFTENLRPFLGEQAQHFPVLELLPFEVYAHNIELIVAFKFRSVIRTTVTVVITVSFQLKECWSFRIPDFTCKFVIQLIVFTILANECKSLYYYKNNQQNNHPLHNKTTPYVLLYLFPIP